MRKKQFAAPVKLKGGKLIQWWEQSPQCNEAALWFLLSTDFVARSKDVVVGDQETIACQSTAAASYDITNQGYKGCWKDGLRIFSSIAYTQNTDMKETEGPREKRSWWMVDGLAPLQRVCTTNPGNGDATTSITVGSKKGQLLHRGCIMTKLWQILLSCQDLFVIER